MNVRKFDIGDGDGVTIHDYVKNTVTFYDDDTGPQDVTISEGTKVEWKSTGNNQGSSLGLGFRICARPAE